MHLSAEHLEIAARLDAKVQRLLGLGYDDLAIFVEMADDMPDFKRLLDAGQALMDELCRRFARVLSVRENPGADRGRHCLRRDPSA